MGYPIGSTNPDGILGKQTLGSIMKILDSISSNNTQATEKNVTKDDEINLPGNPAYDQAYK